MDYQEAEQSYLGCILKNGELIKETTLNGDKLLDPAHKAILNAMQEIDKQGDPVDLVTVITKIGPTNLKAFGGRKYLSDLMGSVPSLERFKVYERYVLDGWKLREANRIQSTPIQDVSELARLRRELEGLESHDGDEEYDHQASLMELHDEIENQKEGLSGIDTGLSDMNRMLEGFHGGDLYISAARPSVGKTAKMLHHADRNCANGGVSAVFSLEMVKNLLNKRFLTMIGRIDGHKMRNPKRFFDERDWENYSRALGILGSYNLHIYDDSGQTVQFIRSKVMKLRKKYPDKPLMIFIDYLQLIRSDGKFDSKNNEVGEISRSLKELARDADAPVYLLSQLSRGVEQRQDKRPMMSDLRDSGNIEQDADVIEFLYRDDYYDAESEKKNIIEAIIAKQRNGSVGTVELAYIKEYNLFLDLDNRYDA